MTISYETIVKFSLRKLPVVAVGHIAELGNDKALVRGLTLASHQIACLVTESGNGITFAQ